MRYDWRCTRPDAMARRLPYHGHDPEVATAWLGVPTGRTLEDVDPGAGWTVGDVTRWRVVSRFGGRVVSFTLERRPSA